jgi:hypothetical protein
MRVDFAIELGDQPEERLVKHSHERAHLVERLQLLTTQLGGAPESVDVLEQTAPSVRLLRVCCTRVAETLELLAHASNRRGYGATSSLGGVRGEHRAQAQGAEQTRESVVTELATDIGERCGERFRRRLSARIRLAQRAGTKSLLRKVDEMEVAGKRASHQLRAIERPRGHQRVGCLGMAAPLIDIGACAYDRAAQQLDMGEQVFTGLLGDHLAKHLTDQAHLVSQRRGHLLTRCVTGA